MVPNRLYWLFVIVFFIATLIKNPFISVLFFTSFLVTAILVPLWIKRAHKAKLVGRDMHKPGYPEVAELGGVPLLIGFLAGVFLFVALRIFYFESTTTGGLAKNDPLLQIMTLLLTVMLVAFIGIIDDILGWKIGLKQWQKPMLVLLAALPLSTIDVGHSIMKIPYLGSIDFEILFPFIIVPVVITITANGFNLIAGYNSLEAGMGIIILSTIGYIAYIKYTSYLPIIALCMVFSLLAFLYYNKFPARIFPGDVMTYSVGVLVGGLAILGNMEKAALILYTPYIIEFFLKMRGRFKKESFAKFDSNNSLIQPYQKIYGLEHLAINLIGRFKKVTEKDVVYFIFGLELVFAVLAILSVHNIFSLLN